MKKKVAATVIWLSSPTRSQEKGCEHFANLVKENAWQLYSTKQSRR